MQKGSAQHERVLATPLARRLAKEKGFDLWDIQPAGKPYLRAADVQRYRPAADREAARDTQPVYGAFVRATPLARRLAKEKGFDLRDIQPAGKPYLRAADVQRYRPAVNREAAQDIPPMHGVRIRATPLARKVAAQMQVDLSRVQAANGIRICKADVLAYSRDMENEILPRESGRERLRGMRKTIAARMQQSYFHYPAATITTEADMWNLQRFRENFNKEYASKGVKLSVTDMIVAAVARALREHKIVNASLRDDEIIYYADVNVGIAVAPETGGLLVPVLRRADTLSLEALSTRSKSLIRMAREGTLGADAMTGATFTVTNLGMFGIDTFSPIINYPESAILGVGRTTDKVVAIDGMIAIRPRASLSLTHDHRLIDGVPAAKFLRTVVHYMENPNLLV